MEYIVGGTDSVNYGETESHIVDYSLMFINNQFFSGVDKHNSVL